jgi:hypothetical protein
VEALAFWLSTIVAMFWLVQFGIVQLVFRGRARDDHPDSRLGVWLVIATFTAGIAVDISVAIIMIGKEYAAYERAVQVEGQVLRGKVAYSGANENYTVVCQFQDGQNVWHNPRFFLQKTTVPPGLAQAVQIQRLPVPVRILYDPERPGRSWIDGVDEPDRHNNRMPVMAFCCLLFSFLVGMTLIASRQRVVPAKVAPFVGVTIPLFMVGVFRFIVGWR